MASDSLDTNLEGDVTGAVAIPVQTLINLFIVAATGSHSNHRTGLQVSPETTGDVWMTLPHVITGEGCHMYNIAAERVRAITVDAEGAASTVTAYIIAR